MLVCHEFLGASDRQAWPTSSIEGFAAVDTKATIRFNVIILFEDSNEQK